MIDWVQLAWNFCWIVGVSFALATLSYASWEARVIKETLAARWNQPGALAAVYASAMLFALGLGGLSSSRWQIIAWFALATLFLGLGMRAISRKKAPP